MAIPGAATIDPRGVFVIAGEKEDAAVVAEIMQAKAHEIANFVAGEDEKPLES